MEEQIGLECKDGTVGDRNTPHDQLKVYIGSGSRQTNGKPVYRVVSKLAQRVSMFRRRSAYRGNS